jgi:hypothetical protein
MRYALVLPLTVPALCAQGPRDELSASIGAGARGAEDLPSGGYSTWGVGSGYRLSDSWTLCGAFAQRHPQTLNMFHGSLMREWEAAAEAPSSR